MMKIPGTIYHKPLLGIIREIKKTKWGKLTVPAKVGKAISGHWKISGNSFTIKFSYLLSKGKDLPFGSQLKNVPFVFHDRHLVLEDFFLGSRSLPSFTASVSQVHTKGYSR